MFGDPSRVDMPVDQAGRARHVPAGERARVVRPIVPQLGVVDAPGAATGASTGGSGIGRRLAAVEHVLEPLGADGLPGRADGQAKRGAVVVQRIEWVRSNDSSRVVTGVPTTAANQ